MKRYLIKALALQVLLGVCVYAYPQEFKANYIYDNNGNRIKATVVFLIDRGENPEVSESISIDEELNTFVNVYPNPTKGELFVDIVNAANETFEDNKSTITVWDVQGKFLHSIVVTNPKVIVNLSNEPNGIYILKLNINGKVHHIKVVKN